MKMLNIEEQTHKRLVSIMDDMVHKQKRNLGYDDVLNELMDVYLDGLALSGENAGG